MGLELNLDNIISGDNIEELFGPEESEETLDQEEIKDETNKTAEVNEENLFAEIPESVGSEDKEDIKEKEDTDSDKDTGISPKSSFYSSIAKALKDEGILPDLESTDVDKIKSPEDFAEAIEKLVLARLDDKQKRIDEALNAGIEPTEIKKYENTISTLESIKEDSLIDESNRGQELRRQLIYQDFINRGFSESRAKRETEKSFNAGTDIEDAKEALISNKEFFSNSYKELVEEAKSEELERLNKLKLQAENLKKSLLEDNEIFGIKLDKSVRQRIFDNIAKPVYKDEDGNWYTAILKYEMEHREEFLKKLGVLFTLSDKFLNLDKLVNDRVKKETRKSLRELEHTLNNTSRDSNGNLRFLSGVDEDDTESKIGFKIDL